MNEVTTPARSVAVLRPLSSYELKPLPPPLPMEGDLLAVARAQPYQVMLFGGPGDLVRLIIAGITDFTRNANPELRALFVSSPAAISDIAAEVDRVDPHLIAVADFPACAKSKPRPRRNADAILAATRHSRRWALEGRAVVLGAAAPKGWNPEKPEYGWLHNTDGYLEVHSDDTFLVVQNRSGTCLRHLGARHRPTQPDTDLTFAAPL